MARAVVRTATDRGLAIPAATSFAGIPGRGVRATVEGREWMVGGPNLLNGIDSKVPSDLSRFAEEAAGRGEAVIYLVGDGSPRAALAVADAVRRESPEAIRALHAAGIRVSMLTGDARAVAEAVGKELGIDDVHAEVLPEQKAKTIEGLRRDGHRVAMVGDGVNDAPNRSTVTRTPRPARTAVARPRRPAGPALGRYLS